MLSDGRTIARALAKLSCMACGAAFHTSEISRPAISDMEKLSDLTDSEWQIRSQEFIQKCDKFMTDIDGIAQATNANVVKNMSRHINALQRRAIEAASEQEE